MRLSLAQGQPCRSEQSGQRFSDGKNLITGDVVNHLNPPRRPRDFKLMNRVICSSQAEMHPPLILPEEVTSAINKPQQRYVGVSEVKAQHCPNSIAI